jgi:hypothetical protein
MQMRPVECNDLHLLSPFTVCLSAVNLVHKKLAFVWISRKSTHPDGQKGGILFITNAVRCVLNEK